MTPGASLHRPAGTLADGPWAIRLDASDAGWAFCGLRVADLAPGAAITWDTGPDEAIVLPLHGGFEIVADRAEPVVLTGRASVWAGPTDFAYLPPATTVTVRTAGGGRFAVPSARAGGGSFPVRYAPAAGVPVELRGGGPCSREVRNFAAADVFAAERLIAVEVLTPAGNWSSYPPHKHDELRPGEVELEEIYAYEVAVAPDGSPGVAYQRVYGTPGRPIDVLAEVRSGDLVLIPHGWHGPSMAAPGYDLFYLNVMAGPGERAWRACDDPAHAWVRDGWSEQGIDLRLPFGRAG